MARAWLGVNAKPSAHWTVKELFQPAREAGISAEELAERAGVSLGTLGGWAGWCGQPRRLVLQLNVPPDGGVSPNCWHRKLKRSRHPRRRRRISWHVAWKNSAAFQAH